MKTNIQKITITAAFAALIFAVTFIVHIPVPGTAGGYINLGDTAIYLAAFLLGGPLAGAAAAIGSALADLSFAATYYIVPTFFIKGLMGLTAGYLSRSARFSRYTVACVLGGLIMTAGYGLYELAVFGSAYALGSLPFNLIQWVGGTAAAIILFPIAKRLSQIRYLKR